MKAIRSHLTFRNNSKCSNNKDTVETFNIKRFRYLLEVSIVDVNVHPMVLCRWCSTSVVPAPVCALSPFWRRCKQRFCLPRNVTPALHHIQNPLPRNPPNCLLPLSTELIDSGSSILTHALTFLRRPHVNIPIHIPRRSILRDHV